MDKDKAQLIAQSENIEDYMDTRISGSKNPNSFDEMAVESQRQSLVRNSVRYVTPWKKREPGSIEDYLKASGYYNPPG